MNTLEGCTAYLNGDNGFQGTADNVLVTVGAAEANYLAVNTFTDPGDEIAPFSRDLDPDHGAEAESRYGRAGDHALVVWEPAHSHCDWDHVGEADTGTGSV